MKKNIIVYHPPLSKGNKEGKGLKALTPNKLLTRPPILLAQI